MDKRTPEATDALDPAHTGQLLEECDPSRDRNAPADCAARWGGDEACVHGRGDSKLPRLRGAVPGRRHLAVHPPMPKEPGYSAAASLLQSIRGKRFHETYIPTAAPVLRP